MMLDRDGPRFQPDFGFAVAVLAQAGIEVVNAAPASRLPQHIWRIIWRKADPAQYLQAPG